MTSLPPAAWPDLAALGPFFALERAAPAGEEAGQARTRGPGSDWAPIATLVSSPEALAALVRAGQASMARTAAAGGSAAGSGDPSSRVPPVDFRAMVSVVTQGLAARLVSPAVGLALLHRVVPSFEALQWQAAAPGPVRLRLPEPVSSAAVTSPRLAARALVEMAMDPVVTPLLRSALVLDRFAPTLLQGNALSALVGAAAMVARTVPAAGQAAAALVDALLDEPGFHGAGVRDGSGFRRSTCCLYYRLPVTGMCGDCPIAVRPARPRSA